MFYKHESVSNCFRLTIFNLTFKSNHNKTGYIKIADRRSVRFTMKKYGCSCKTVKLHELWLDYN